MHPWGPFFYGIYRYFSAVKTSNISLEKKKKIAFMFSPITLIVGTRPGNPKEQLQCNVLEQKKERINR